MTLPLFYISSRGSSATAWIAKMLSMHQKLVCFHGTRSVPPTESGINDLSPEGFSDALITCTKSCQGQKIFGAVHGFYGISAKQAVEVRGGTFSAIIRHPVKRIHSQFSDNFEKGLFLTDEREKNAFLQVYSKKLVETDKPHYYEDIIEKKYNHVSNRIENGNVILSSVESLFFSICDQMISCDVVCMEEAGKRANFRMEDITSSPEDFESFFRFVTADTIEPSGGYLDEVFSSKKVNRHVKKMDSNDIYQSWPDSFQFIFQKVMQKYGERSTGIYGEMDYELPEIGTFRINGPEIVKAD